MGHGQWTWAFGSLPLRDAIPYQFCSIFKYCSNKLWQIQRSFGIKRLFKGRISYISGYIWHSSTPYFVYFCRNRLVRAFYKDCPKNCNVNVQSLGRGASASPPPTTIDISLLWRSPAIFSLSVQQIIAVVKKVVEWLVTHLQRQSICCPAQLGDQTYFLPSFDLQSKRLHS